ncbi:hypothetical protein [Nannocystis pusilla]|uniref:hypothetical protein n=1 Tax=Nannocystis pusilla TaxID=889268 RepID=UPI003B81B1DB
MISSTKCESIRRRGLTAGLACVFCLADVVPAAAAPASGDKAAAEALFKEGRARVEAGDDAGGCPNSSTAWRCIRRRVRRSIWPNAMSARASWRRRGRPIRRRSSTMRRPGTRAGARAWRRSRARIAALEPRLPRLRVVVEDAPAEVAITRDGQPVPESDLGEAVPIDPGQHEIGASAPGHQPLRRSVELVEGKTETVTLKLAPVRVEAADAKRGDRRGKVPAWAWATGGVGLGLMGASVYFLVDNRAAVADLKAHCQDVPGGTYCDPGYDFAADNARKNRDLGLFIGLGTVGLAAVTVAIVEIARSKAGKRRAARTATATPWLAPGAGGLGVVGRF